MGHSNIYLNNKKNEFNQNIQDSILRNIQIHEAEPYFDNVNRLISLMCRVYANRPGDQVSIPGRVIPKT